jgi:F0F1-type ATP synthase membrane subunit c/vacuolar-type H+-ATPase subunit K
VNQKLWTFDPTKNITKPYLWDVDIIKGPPDNVSIIQTSVQNQAAIGLKLDRVNQNNSNVWTTLHIRQDLHGQALDAVFRSEISLMVFPTFHLWFDTITHSPENTFGIEINDGTNLLWFVFSDSQSQTFQLPHHRIVLTETPLNEWSTRSVGIAAQWQAAGWKKPDSLSFILILGTTLLHPGTWVGYFANLSVNVATFQAESLSSGARLGILIADALVILGLTAIILLMEKRQRNRSGGRRRSKA